MKFQSVIHFLVFICFLVIGYTFSLRFYRPDDSQAFNQLAAVTAESQSSIPSMKNGQHSLVLISANSIATPDPQLESVWLVTYFPSNTMLQLMPIYPTGHETLSEFEQELDRAFKLNKQDNDLVIDQGFLNVLKRNNYWWSAYILLDEVSLVKILDQYDGIELNGKALSGAQAVSELQTARENPREAFSSQVALLQSLCHQAGEIGPVIAASQLQSIIPDHLLTDLDAGQLQAEFDALRTNKHSPTCRFPTLEVSRIEP